jgi:hypothetical protein
MGGLLPCSRGILASDPSESVVIAPLAIIVNGSQLRRLFIAPPDGPRSADLASSHLMEWTGSPRRACRRQAAAGTRSTCISALARDRHGRGARLRMPVSACCVTGRDVVTAPRYRRNRGTSGCCVSPRRSTCETSPTVDTIAGAHRRGSARRSARDRAGQPYRAPVGLGLASLTSAGSFRASRHDHGRASQGRRIPVPALDRLPRAVHRAPSPQQSTPPGTGREPRSLSSAFPSRSWARLFR